MNIKYLFYRRNRQSWQLPFRLWVTIAFCCLLTVVASGLIGAGIYSIEQRSCSETARRMNLESDFGVWSGCMVRINEVLVPIDSVRVNSSGEFTTP